MGLAYHPWGVETLTLLEISGEKDRDKSLKEQEKELLAKARKAQKETAELCSTRAKPKYPL